MHRIEAFITLALIFIVILSILYIPIFFVLRKRGVAALRQLSYFGLGCAIILTVFATLLFVLPDFSSLQRSFNLQPFQWLEAGGTSPQLLTEVIPNVMMFIPLGVFIPAVFARLRKFQWAILALFLTTLSIELTQFVIGRAADIDDIIANLLGGLIGFSLFALANHLLRNKQAWKTFIGTNSTDSDMAVN